MDAVAFLDQVRDYKASDKTDDEDLHCLDQTFVRGTEHPMNVWLAISFDVLETVLMDQELEEVHNDQCDTDMFNTYLRWILISRPEVEEVLVENEAAHHNE